MFDESPSGVWSQPSSDGPKPTLLFAQLDAHTESNFFCGYSGDLRDGGLFIVTYEPLEVGQAVEVDLSLPSGHFVSVAGRVAWHRVPSHGQHDLSPGVGIVLHDLDDRAQALIGAFMRLREPSFVDPDVLSQDASPQGNAVRSPSPADAQIACEAPTDADPPPDDTVQAAPEPAPKARPKAQNSPTKRGKKRRKRGKRR